MAHLEELPASGDCLDLIVIPIISTSGSMTGNKICQVNEAMREVPEQLKKISSEFMDGKLLIAPMEYSTGVRWLYLSNGKPVEAELFRWIDLKSGGNADFGAALRLLREKLTTEDRGGWLENRYRVAPIIILISDGRFTDDYEKELNELKKEYWFKTAIKFAVAVGEDADKKVLTEFTGFDETVIDPDVIRLNLKSIVKKVSVPLIGVTMLPEPIIDSDCFEIKIDDDDIF